MKEKQHLREIMRRQITALSDAQKSTESRCIGKKVSQHIEALRAAATSSITVASFAALCAEPDLIHLQDTIKNVHWVYPLAKLDGTMAFYHVDNPDSFIKGLYGIQEPNPSLHHFVPLASIDLFLVPALAYTQNGTRLGKGGGYYDRALSQRAPHSQTLGICFSCQIVHHIPAEAHDISVDQVIVL